MTGVNGVCPFLTRKHALGKKYLKMPLGTRLDLLIFLEVLALVSDKGIDQ